MARSKEPILPKEELTDVGLPRRKSEEMKREIQRIFEVHQVRMSPMTLISIAYSTDPPTEEGSN